MNLARTQALLDQFCRMVKQEYGDIIEAEGSRVQGDMAENFYYDVQVYKNSFEITFELEQPDGYMQEFGVGYGSFRGYDMGGRFPNLDNIEDWVDDKEIRFEYRKGRRVGEPMSFKETVFLVRRKIAREGFDARFFFERAVDRTFPYLEEELVNKFGLDVEDFLKQLEIYD